MGDGDDDAIHRNNVFCVFDKDVVSYEYVLNVIKVCTRRLHLARMMWLMMRCVWLEAMIVLKLMVSYSQYLFSTMWIFLNIVNLVDFSFCYTLKIPFYYFFDTKLIFVTGLRAKSSLRHVTQVLLLLR